MLTTADLNIKKFADERQTRLIKQKEEEVGDLQIQMQEIQKFINDNGKQVIDGLNKCSQENDNLVKWLKIYDEQIKNQEKEIYAKEM